MVYTKGHETMEMNKGQLEAINTIEGQLCIVACPGSGKTTTLLNRINHMVEEGIDPASILMVTFTKAAADSMKERYKESFDATSKAEFCTIHSFCYAVVRKFSPEAMTGGVLSESQAINYFFTRLKYAKNVGNKAEFIRDLLLDISVYKNSQTPLSEYKPRSCKIDTFKDAYKAYESFKKEQELIDFDDMQLIAYDVLCNDADALKWIRDKYRYILVDEYQDINELQRDIIYELAGENGNLAVVGDDDQSIYGFRGANPKIMLSFKDAYPNSRVIYLDTNYRSKKEIVDFAAKLISKNKNRFDKNFLADKGLGAVVEIESQKTRGDEIKSLINRVKKDIRKGVNPNEIAITFRTNKQGIAIAKAMLDSQIEFKSNDKLTGIYDHWIYTDILAYYHVASGTATKYEFNLTLNHPQRFLFDRRYSECGPIPSKSKMLEINESSSAEKWKKDAAKEKIEGYFNTIIAIKRSKTPEEAIKALLLFGRYKDYLKQYAEYRNEDIDELYDILEEITEAAKQAGSWEIWNEMAAIEKEELKAAMEGKNGVTLTTMHSAKGLEWDEVYIMDCNDGKNPFIKAESEDEFEEERRLFYVAMTRAREKLVLMYSQVAGTYELKVSPYLIECELPVKHIVKDSSIRQSIRRTNNETFYDILDDNIYSRIKTDYSEKNAGDDIQIDAKAGDFVESVYHGVGQIKAINEGMMTITFSDGTRDFSYPLAFKKSLKLLDLK